MRGSRRRLVLPSPVWGWVNDMLPNGKTVLEENYARSSNNLRKIFEQPLPEMPNDETTSPDFIVGFSKYDHRMRDAYRAAIAAGLNTKVSSVSLSVGWSGRIDTAKFNNVRKLCGVKLNDEMRETRCIAEFVSLVESKSDPQLLALQIVGASTTSHPNATSPASSNADDVSLMDFLANFHCVVICENEDQKDQVDERCRKIFQQHQIVPKVLCVRKLAEETKLSQERCIQLLFRSAPPLVFFDGCFVGSVSTLEHLHKNRKLFESLLNGNSDVQIKSPRKRSY